MRVGTQPPIPEMTCGFLIQLVFCKKKTMWLIGVEVEQKTSAPPPKRNPGSTPAEDACKQTQHRWPSISNIVICCVAFCAPCCIFLRALGSCCAKFGTDQTFSYVQSDATSQCCWANNAGSFCVRLRVVLVPLIVYTKAQCDSYL